jgi:hypothetical protein
MSKTMITFKKSLLVGLTGAITIAITPAFSQQSRPEKNIDCTIIGGVRKTVGYDSNNNNEPIAIITWDKKYIDSQDIEQDCKNAANKITEFFKPDNPEKTNLYLAYEPQVLSESNVKDGIALYNICLVSRPGITCDTNQKLVRIKKRIKEEKLSQILPTIINPNFAKSGEIDRTFGRGSVKIERNFIEKLLGIRGR